MIIAGSITFMKMGETSCQKLEKMSILYQECIKRKNLPNCYHGQNHRQRSAASRLRNPHSCTYYFSPRTTFFEIHISVIYILYPTSPQKKINIYNFCPRTTFIEIHIFVIYISYPTSPKKKRPKKFFTSKIQYLPQNNVF